MVSNFLTSSWSSMISSTLSSISVDACAGAVDVDELATGGVGEAGTVCVDEAGSVGVDTVGRAGAGGRAMDVDEVGSANVDAADDRE